MSGVQVDVADPWLATWAAAREPAQACPGVLTIQGWADGAGVDGHLPCQAGGQAGM